MAALWSISQTSPPNYAYCSQAAESNMDSSGNRQYRYLTTTPMDFGFSDRTTFNRNNFHGSIVPHDVPAVATFGGMETMPPSSTSRPSLDHPHPRSYAAAPHYSANGGGLQSTATEEQLHMVFGRPEDAAVLNFPDDARNNWHDQWVSMHTQPLSLPPPFPLNGALAVPGTVSPAALSLGRPPQYSGGSAFEAARFPAMGESSAWSAAALNSFIRNTPAAAPAPFEDSANSVRPSPLVARSQDSVAPPPQLPDAHASSSLSTTTGSRLPPAPLNPRNPVHPAPTFFSYGLGHGVQPPEFSLPRSRPSSLVLPQHLRPRDRATQPPIGSTTGVGSSTNNTSGATLSTLAQSSEAMPATRKRSAAAAAATSSSDSTASAQPASKRPRTSRGTPRKASALKAESATSAAGEDIVNLVDKDEWEPPTAPEPPNKDNWIKLGTFQCSICLDNATNITVTHCGHLFCGDCLRQSMNSSTARDKCPLCRQPVDNRPRSAYNPRTKGFWGLELKLTMAPRKSAAPSTAAKREPAP